MQRHRPRQLPNYCSSRHFRALTVVVLLLGGSELIHAENWTRFRGPNGSGIANDVTFPATWTEQDYLWKITLPGVGHSSPVGWEQRLFITTGNVETGTVTLQALAAESGEQLWQRDFAGEKNSIHRSNSYASSTPTVDQQYVYMTWADGGRMHCVALTHQGDEIWRVELGDFVGPHGFAASPVVVEGIVCVQVEDRGGGLLAGIDAADGQLRWRAERLPGKASYATPCVVANAGGSAAVISQSMTGGMQAVEVQTGKLLWQFPALFPARCVSSPSLLGDNDLGGPTFATPAVHDGKLILRTESTLACLAGSE